MGFALMSLWIACPFDGEALGTKDDFEGAISDMSGRGLGAIARWAGDVR